MRSYWRRQRPCRRCRCQFLSCFFVFFLESCVGMIGTHCRRPVSIKILIGLLLLALLGRLTVILKRPFRPTFLTPVIIQSSAIFFFTCPSSAACCNGMPQVGSLRSRTARQHLLDHLPIHQLTVYKQAHLLCACAKAFFFLRRKAFTHVSLRHKT